MSKFDRRITVLEQRIPPASHGQEWCVELGVDADRYLIDDVEVSQVEFQHTTPTGLYTVDIGDDDIQEH